VHLPGRVVCVEYTGPELLRGRPQVITRAYLDLLTAQMERLIRALRSFKS